MVPYRASASASIHGRPWIGFAITALVAAALTGGLTTPASAARAKLDPEARKAKAKERAAARAKAKAKARKAATRPAKPTTAPASTRPADPALAAKRAMRVKLATDYLTNWYAKQLNSTDWMARAVALVSISRMPTAESTVSIIKQLEVEKRPVCRLVAWQAALARANMLSEAQHESWLAATRLMIRAELFHGDLRIGLLEMLGSAPIDTGSRTYFRNLMARTSSLDSSDVPTLIAMGQCLRSWGDAGMVELLIKSLSNPSTVVRAELVLQAAGVGPEWNRTPSARREYHKWWLKHKADFTASTPQPEQWKKLKPQYLDPPIELAKFDVLDLKWRREMELDRLQLRSFAFAIALDCSRSMGGELARIKRDMRVMFSAFSQIAREVGVGFTLFAPGGELRHYPLTDSQSKLMARVNSMEIFGPAGEEEWAGAIDKAMNDNRWPRLAKDSRRAIVIITDEPIAAAQFARAMPLAEAGAKKGFRLYGIMVHSLTNAPNNPLSRPLDRTTGASLYKLTPPLNSAPKKPTNPKMPGKAKQPKPKPKKARGGWGHYDQLAKATGGRALDVLVPQGGLGLGLPPSKAGGKAGKMRGNDPMAIAPIYPGGGPTNNILTVVLTDAIGPNHADRVEPLVKILAAYCQKNAARIPERRTWQPPGHMEPNLNKR